jgi:hypothetical protein
MFLVLQTNILDRNRRHLIAFMNLNGEKMILRHRVGQNTDSLRDRL